MTSITPMTQRIPIGVSDFRELREQGLVYVDKSHLIREILDKGTQTFLLPRPRRRRKSPRAKTKS